MLLVNLKVILEKHGKPLTNLLPVSWMVPLFLDLVSFLMLLMTGARLAKEIPPNDNNNDLSYINNINVNHNTFRFSSSYKLI